MADVFELSDDDGPDHQSGRRLDRRLSSSPPHALPSTTRGGPACHYKGPSASSCAAFRDGQTDYPRGTRHRFAALTPPLRPPHTAEQVLVPVGALQQKWSTTSKSSAMTDGLQVFAEQREAPSERRESARMVSDMAAKEDMD